MSCNNYPHGEDNPRIDPVTERLLREAFDELTRNTDSGPSLTDAMGFDPVRHKTSRTLPVPTHTPTLNSTKQRPMAARGFKKRKR